MTINLLRNYIYLKTGIVFIIFGFLCISVQNSHAQTNINSEETVALKGPGGRVILLPAQADDDGDGIDNSLEINGFVYNASEGLQPWDGDSSKTWFITDPLRWSTDGDPYSDYTEATGVNMHSAVPYPESHPLVASRPVIDMELVSYDVIPIGTITDTEGEEESSSFTNTTTSQHEVGGSVTVGVTAKLSPFELAEASVEVTASYSHTWSKTESSTSSLGKNWSQARSTNPSEAARLKLTVFMENVGSAPALNVQPEFNLKVGDKLIATIKPSFVQNELSTDERSEDIVIDKDDNGDDIVLSLDELKAIQTGMPLSLVVTQVAAEVPRWNSVTKSFESGVTWSSFEGDIDPVVVNLDANFGDGEQYFYQIYTGTKNFDPGFSFRDILSMVFNVERIGGKDYIEGRQYPDDWYVVASHDLVQDWDNAGRPESMMDLHIKSKNIRNSSTQEVVKMNSPGLKLGPVVNLATFTPNFRQVLVSASPNAFPLLSAKAKVTVNGEEREITLQHDGAFYKNSELLEYPANPRATVFMEDVRGDQTEANTVIPAFYTSAEEVLRYSPLLEVPGGDEYLLFLNGDTTKPAVIYCDFSVVEVDTIAQEYLTLNSGEQSNFTDGSNDGIYRGRVYFKKIRVNLIPDSPNLTVVPSDLRFVETDIQDFYYAVYGSSSLCNPPDTSAANIDLSGTPFKLDPFTQFSSESNIDIDERRKIVDIDYQLNSDHCAFAGVSGTFRLVYDTYEDFEVTEGLFGHSLQFNSTGSDPVGYVDMGDPVTLEVSDAITLEAWIKPALPADSQKVEVILNKEGEYELFRWSDGTIRWAIANSNPGWATQNTYYKAKHNEWVHIALVYDQLDANPAINTYINGNLFHGQSGSGAIGDFSSHVNQDSFRVAGREANKTSFFRGSIDEVRVWNTALTGSDIRSDFVKTLGPEVYESAESGLIGYWRFDKLEDLGVGKPGVNDVRDLSVNQNHGELIGDVLLSADVISGISIEKKDVQPEKFFLSQNYPNPFNPVTTISYQLPKNSDVRLSIYNIQGQKVATLVSENQLGGQYTISFDASKLASGIYFYHLEAGNFQATRRMVLIK